MNKIITIITFLALSCATPYIYASSDNSFIIGLTRSSHFDDEDDEVVKHRMPPRTLVCTITTDGVTISGVDETDIIMYEAYSEYGECVAAFASEQDFISWIFMASQSVELRFHTPTATYSGWFSL